MEKPTRIDKSTLNCRAMGISNAVYGDDKKSRFSTQFYDYDYNGSDIKTIENHVRLILRIFPYDLLLYKTKHGIQFISFALLKGFQRTKINSVETSKLIGNQDYWTTARDLTLRVSPKWLMTYQWTQFNYYKILRQNISKKPEFSTIIKEPKKYIISQKHLEFYYKYMNLPEDVYNLYSDCDLRDYKIKIYHYQTRD